MSDRTRSVVVTGAARGIGEATARLLAGRGWSVCAVDLEPCAWAEGPAGVPGVTTRALDVTDPEAWQRVLGEFCGAAGLDALVNNAGLLYGTAFAEGSYRQDSALVDVNVKGVLYGCRAALPFLERARGRVVNLCSASAIYGQPEMATYSATKFAVRGITEALELEWESRGVAVTAVWPLFVPTGMLDGVHTRGMGALGVHLRPGDVAAVVADAVEGRGDGWRRRTCGLLTRVHRPVGRQAHSMYLASQFAPNWVTRLVNRRLTR